MALVYSAPAKPGTIFCGRRPANFVKATFNIGGISPAAGVRTRCSDDFLWLPFVTYHYVATAGDAAIREVQARLLQGPVLCDDQQRITASPYQARKLRVFTNIVCGPWSMAVALAAHGLPLMGAGDWNDGMNRVGKDGRW